jgi:hypothetical protein
LNNKHDFYSPGKLLKLKLYIIQWKNKEARRRIEEGIFEDFYGVLSCERDGPLGQFHFSPRRSSLHFSIDANGKMVIRRGKLTREKNHKPKEAVIWLQP